MHKIVHGSLFSGIGGFDLAAEWMGWENIFQVEKDSFCQKVLEKNFPNTKRYGDIKEFDGTKYRGAVDIISGGFPCQPFSVAGKRKGANDDRFLWPEMLRVIREVKPSFIVGENVTGIIGLALDQVLSEVEAEGYYTETFIIPACGVNAPHKRDRVWIVAYTRGTGRTQYQQASRTIFNSERNLQIQTGRRQAVTNGITGSCELITNPDSQGLQVGQFIPGMEGRKNGRPERQDASFFDGWPTQPPVCGRNDGIPNRVDRIKSLGNAIVPQIAFEIFKAIEHYATTD